jgi:hypothetical protein
MRLLTVQSTNLIRSVRMHETTPESLDGFSLNFVFENLTEKLSSKFVSHLDRTN